MTVHRQHLRREDLHSVALAEISFVVVDIETTGGQSDVDAITEIGAVKVRGGEVVGTFHTLIDPGTVIPPFIVRLTGITQAMVQGQPPLATVIGPFLDFINDSVVVAHNAPFDVGFLSNAAKRHGHVWPAVPVLDTVRLARALIPQGSVPNHKLGTLAEYVGAVIKPSHRALDDAKATADVLHYLFEIAGGQGLHTFAEFASVTTAMHKVQRAKRHLAQGMPEAPGVYTFRSASGEALYIGMSGNLRHRIGSYFTASEKRARMLDLISATHEIVPEPLPTRLEAEVEEAKRLRNIKPPYNSRDTKSGTAQWLRVSQTQHGYTTSVARVKRPDELCLGPYSNRSDVLSAQSVFECDWARGASFEQVVSACTLDPTPLLDTHLQMILSHSRAGEFEAAAALQRHLEKWLDGARSNQAIESLRQAGEVLAAQRTFEGGWNIALLRQGLLVATGHAQPGEDANLAASTLLARHQGADSVGTQALGTWSETMILHRWLSAPTTRMVHISGLWADSSSANFTLQQLPQRAQAISKALQGSKG